MKKDEKNLQRLPDSELDIMLALWNGNPPMSRAEIEAFVNQEKDLAPTTILSLLSRLEARHFVAVEKQGKMNLYTPLVSQADYQAHESRSILERLYGNSLKRFTASLFQGKDISTEEIQDLKDFLDDIDSREEQK